MNTLKTYQFPKSHLVQISAYSNTWTKYIRLSEFVRGKKKGREFLKKKMLVFKVAILCVWVKAGWCGGGSVGLTVDVLMRFV